MPRSRSILQDLGFNEFYRRDEYVVAPTVEIPISAVNQEVPNSSIDLSKTTLDTFQVNQWIRGGATGYNAGTGWWLGNDGTAYKFFIGNSAGNKITWDGTTLTVSGSLIAGNIHIPDMDTTANSFHVESDGDTWWGCTQTNWTASHNNANAYVLSTGIAQFQAVTITGASSSITGNAVCGGWTATASGTLANGTNIILDASNKAISINNATFGQSGIQLQYNAGTPRAYIGNGSTQYFNFDGTQISWATPNTSLDTAGKLTTVSADVGGWNVVTGYIYNLQSGTPTSSPNDGLVIASGNEGIIVYEDTAKRVELGYLSSGVYGLKGYATNGTDVVFELSDTQQKLAGFYFTDTVLRSNITDASSNIFIDSANSLIRAGATTGDYLTLDGGNLRLRSSNYSMGVSGFTIEPTLIEAENLRARGIMSGVVFQYDVKSVLGGQSVWANADVLELAMTALDSTTLTTKGTTTFSVNDLLVIRAITSSGIQEEWLRVTNIGSAPTYTVTRDLAGLYGANANPIWQAGTAVIKQGTSDGGASYGGGWLQALGEGTNSPYFSVYSRTGVAYNSYSERTRFGNLNGYLDYATDVYGFGAGSSSGTNANITIDPTNGIRIRKGTTNSLTLDNSGNITVGEVGAGLANTYISSGALSIRLNTTSLFGVDTSGNVTVGEVGSGLSNTYISAGRIAIRNNTTEKFIVDSSGNAFFAGTVTLGDGTNTSGILSLNHADTKGDTYISGGTVTASTWTCTGGFLMGIDDSDSDKVKFYLGTSGSSVDYNVTTLNTLTVSGAITATSGSITGAFSVLGALTVGTSGTIGSGQSAYNTGTGWWWEYNGGTPRMSLGDGTSTNSLTWNGTLLTAVGSVKNMVSLEAGEAISQYNAVRIHTDGKIYKASSITSGWANSVIGFAPSAISASATGKIQLNEDFTTTGLSAGNIYYIADGTLDQTQTDTSGGVNSIYSGGPGRGQTFTVGGGVTKLDWFEFYAKKVLNGCGNLYFELYATSAGLPTGGVLATSETIATSSYSTSLEWHVIRFMTPVSVTAGTMYAIIAVVDGGDSSNYVGWQNPASDVYAGGTELKKNGSWATVASDYTFKTGYTTGAISTSVGTTTKKIGISLSSTSLYILNS